MKWAEAAVAPPLCASKGFPFVERGDSTCQATLAKEVELGEGTILPDGVIKGIPVKGGSEARADLHLDGSRALEPEARLHRSKNLT
jgi:hypothetical protein